MGDNICIKILGQVGGSLAGFSVYTRNCYDLGNLLGVSLLNMF